MGAFGGSIANADKHGTTSWTDISTTISEVKAVRGQGHDRLRRHRAYKKQTLDAIQAAKAFVAGLSEEEIRRRNVALLLPGRSNNTRVPCPAGDHKCIVGGQAVEVSPARLVDGEIVVTRTFMPTSLTCPICDLRLLGNAAIVEAGAGAPYTVNDVQDPIDFHNIDVMDYLSDEDVKQLVEARFEPEYGND